MALIFKMDLVWWVNFFIQYVLPIFGLVIAACVAVLMNLNILERRNELYERS